MRYCIFCEIQLADGVRGKTRLAPSLVAAFGKTGAGMVIPVAESAMPDEEEHMAFEHGFVPESIRRVNDKVVEQGPWVCIGGSVSVHEFGERWVRTGPRIGKRVRES